MYDDVGRQIEGRSGEVPVPRPHDRAMGALDAAVTRLEKADSLLRERVAPLLGPGRPEVVGEARLSPVDSREESSLTNAVCDLTTRIDQASTRIEAVLDRLEI